jgi:hypothetical protein
MRVGPSVLSKSAFSIHNLVLTELPGRGNCRPAVPFDRDGRQASCPFNRLKLTGGARNATVSSRDPSASLRVTSAALIALSAGVKRYSLSDNQERYRYRSEFSKLELEQKSTEKSAPPFSANTELCLRNNEAANRNFPLC